MKIIEYLLYFFSNFFRISPVSYKGRYDSFLDADKHCIGYDSDEIINKVKQSTLAVIDGKAEYERDSCLFYSKDINYNLMMYFYKMKMELGNLHIVDYGGALGSVFWQHKDIINKLGCSWTVIEQDKFVDFGKSHLEQYGIQFRYSPHSVNDFPHCNCLLFSSVLQYLNNYEEVIQIGCQSTPDYIVLERTPVNKRKRWIWIEYVKEPIYYASYPAFVFLEEDLIKHFTDNNYELIDSWESLVDRPICTFKDIVVFKSCVFRRK